MSNAYHLSQVGFSYQQKQVLSIDKLDIRANKITALIGPNGCGKSTLLNLLAFLKNRSQGHMLFFSEQVEPKKFRTLIQRVSFLPQTPYMLRGTVVDNLALALKLHKVSNNINQHITEALELLAITHLALKPANSLSGGEQQKVALARAIVTSPDVLLMDEPFSYLDHYSEQLLENFIRIYAEGHDKTVVFSTHNRLQGIAIADDVVSLVQGKVVNSALINLFKGTLNQQQFDTGKIQINLKTGVQNFQYISIDPNKIELLRVEPIGSSDNKYQGRVMAIADEKGKIRVSLLAGELLQVVIPLQTFQSLNFSLGDKLWLCFQPDSILML